MRAVRWKVCLVLRVIHGGLRHEGIPVHLRSLGDGGTNLLDHVLPHPADVTPGRRARAHSRLGGVPSGNGMAGVSSENAILDGRGCGGCVMPDVRELRLALEVRGQHVRIHAAVLRGSAVLVVTPIVIGAAVEIRRAFVFIWATMLHISSQFTSTQYGLYGGRERDVRMCIL